MAKEYGQSQVIENIGGNAYKLQLPSDTVVSTTFIILIWKLTWKPLNLRSNPYKEGDIDAELNPMEA